MKAKVMFIAALLPSCAFAQPYPQAPSTGRQFDQFGRAIPSIEELCREGQMAGGPITPQCGLHDYRFNRKGERLARYDFTKWGYNVLDNSVTETDAKRLDSDGTFRAKYIKQHGYGKFRLASAEPPTSTSFTGDHSAQCREESEMAVKVAQGSAKGVPIDEVRATMTRVLDSNHVSTGEYNRNMSMLNRVYAWQQRGFTFEQIRDADFRACEGTPTLRVPEAGE